MISEASLIALKTEVERIVRPVRASRRRLDKMREELWSHLAARAEFLMEAGIDEPRAVADAICLLGDRPRLAAELQASAPIAERVLWTRWDAPRWAQRAARSLWGVDERGQAIRRRAAAIRTEAFFATLLLAVNPVMRLLISGQRESLRVWLFGAGLCLLVIPMHAVLAGSVERLYRRLLAPQEAERPGRIALQWGLLYCTIFAVGPLLAAMTRSHLLFDAGDLALWCVAATCGTLGLAAMTLAAAADRRHREEWESLVETE